jgi:SAM-dependent methyltransferase
MIRKLIEKILYSVGLNLSAYDVKSELRLLKKNLPDSFKGRRAVDIGCGDGRVSLKINKVIKSKTFQGVDLSPSLIFMAKKRGLDARILDVATQDLSGDLGILWGVVHHFRDPVKTLTKINKNFKSLIIRAPVHEKRICELGHKFDEDQFLKLLSQSKIDRNKCKIIRSNSTKSLIIFTNLDSS